MLELPDVSMYSVRSTSSGFSGSTLQALMCCCACDIFSFKWRCAVCDHFPFSPPVDALNVILSKVTCKEPQVLCGQIPGEGEHTHYPPPPPPQVLWSYVTLQLDQSSGVPDGGRRLLHQFCVTALNEFKSHISG